MLPFLPLLGALAGVLLFGLARVLPPSRRLAESLSTRALVVVHLVRGAGAAFIVLARKSLLPPEVAERFGIGEVAVAVLAAGVLWLLTMPLGRKPRTIVAWSAFGLINVAWFSHAWIGEAAVSTAAARIAALPLVLYPAAIIPLAVASHLELLRRALGRSAGR